MKKIYTLLLLIAFGFSANANPIELPHFWISELFLDQSDGWQLELYYYDVMPDMLTIDSAFLFSSTHSIKLPTFELEEPEGLVVITSESLNGEFNIGRYADTIKVISYCMGEYAEDILIFGNLPGSFIDFPRTGQSIANYYWHFSKDKSPSIGFPNDTLGMCGTLTGVIYDINLEPVKNRPFRMDFNFETNENGQYTARMLSKPSEFNWISHKMGQYSFQRVNITDISYVMEPDSIIVMDIFLLDSLKVGITHIEAPNPAISIYPNPVTKNEKINIHIDLPVNSANISIEIIDINGRVVKTKRVASTSSYITAPDRVGAYIVRAIMDGKPISSHKIIVNE